MGNKIKIMLVEDQKLMRMAIKSLFEGHSDMEITKEMLETQDYVKSETTEPAAKPSRRR